MKKSELKNIVKECNKEFNILTTEENVDKVKYMPYKLNQLRKRFDKLKSLQNLYF